MGSVFSDEAPQTKQPSIQPNTTMSKQQQAAGCHLYDSMIAEAHSSSLSAVLSKRICVAGGHLGEMLIEQGVMVSQATFLKFLESVCKPATPRVLLETLWTMCVKRSVSLNDPEFTPLHVFVSLVLSFSLGVDNSSFSSTNEALVPVEIVNRFVKWMNSKAQKPSSSPSSEALGSSFDLTSLVLWAQEWGPNTHKVVQSFMVQTLLPFDKGEGFVAYCPPLLKDGGSTIVKEQDLAPLALYSSLLHGGLRRLYTSSLDGYSFQHILSALCGYDGPTLVLFKAKLPKSAPAEAKHARVVFGALATERWREDRRFFGSSSTILFALSPDFKILRGGSGAESNYQWLNTRASNRKTHGLAFGGSSDFRNHRIFLPSSMDYCVATGVCGTFEAGALVPSYAQRTEGAGVFDIDTIEVWAVGGDRAIEDAIKARGLTRELKADALQKARKCDKAAFFGNAFDAENFLGKTMAHRAEQENRL
jgi:hypothetical protein